MTDESPARRLTGKELEQARREALARYRTPEESGYAIELGRKAGGGGAGFWVPNNTGRVLNTPLKRLAVATKNRKARLKEAA